MKKVLNMPKRVGASNFRFKNSQKALIRWLFLVVAIMLPLQYFVSKRFEEPYPAIILPGFGGISGYSGDYFQYEQPEIVFVSFDGQEKAFSQGQLLSPFPDSHHQKIMHQSFHFSLDENEPLSGTYPKRVKRKLNRIFPHFKTGFLNRMARENQESVRIWLKDRSRLLVPEMNIASVEVRWYDSRYTFTKGKAHNDRKLIGTLRMPLAE